MRLFQMVLVGVMVLSPLVACGSPRRLESGTRERITTTDQIDIDDAIRAADTLTASLLESPAFAGAATGGGAGGGTPVVEVSSFINLTSDPIDRDFILKKVRTQLTRSGVVQLRQDLSEDARTLQVQARNQRQAEEDAFLRGLETKEVARNVQALADPDYTLTMKLLQDSVTTPFNRERSFIFQMTVTDIASANIVWEDEEIITKQARGLGF